MVVWLVLRVVSLYAWKILREEEDLRGHEGFCRFFVVKVMHHACTVSQTTHAY